MLVETTSRCIYRGRTSHPKTCKVRDATGRSWYIQSHRGSYRCLPGQLGMASMFCPGQGSSDAAGCQCSSSRAGQRCQAGGSDHITVYPGVP